MIGTAKDIITVIFLTLTITYFSSCGGSQTTLESLKESPTSSPEAPTPAPPVPTEAAPTIPSNYNVSTDFFVTLDGATTYSHYVSQLNSYGSHCKIASGTSMPTAIDCVVEAPELGFYFGGAELVLNVPAGMCEYTRVVPYWYYNNEVGIGPEQIGIETTTTDGKPTGARCSVNGDPLGSCDVSFTEAYFNQSSDGDVKERCSYDSSGIGGHNCCFGNYKITTTSIKINSGVTTVTASTGLRSWGGEMKQCVGGQGKTNWEKYSKSGYPSHLIIETRDDAELRKFVVNAPIISIDSRSNIPLANYYTSAVIDPIVAADQHMHTGFSPLNTTSSVLPYYVAPISDRSGDAIGTSSSAYEFSCLNEAFETKYRIRMYLRDWDTYSAFNDYKTTGVFSGSKPWDIVPSWVNGGLEGVNCDGLSPELCNDFRDPDNFVFDQHGSTYFTAPASATSRGRYFPADSY